MTNVIINIQFSALHSWPGCNLEEVLYLKNSHRHLFHVRMKWKVTHDDRDIEFIRMKMKVDKHLAEEWENYDLGAWSCEHICKELAKKFKADYVRVMEDGENGVEYFPEEDVSL